MLEYFFTFGYGHNYEGGSLENCYTIVESISYDEACAKMYALRGNRWAFCYTSAVRAGVDEFNLELVPFEELTAQLED